MDQSIIFNFKKTISENKNFLIIIPDLANTDAVAAATVLYSFLTNTLKKNALIASSNKIPVRFTHILTAMNIEEKQIVSEIQPLQYAITIKDTEKDLELNVNRKDDEVEIVLTPKISEIDLSKITLSTIGVKFDLIITLNVETLEDLGQIYLNNTNLFENTKVAAVNGYIESAFAKENIANVKYTTVSETIYEILKGFGANIDSVSKDVLFEGITEGTDGLHKVRSKHAAQVTLDLSDDANFSQKLQDMYYTYSNEGLELRKKIFSNIKYSQGICHSTLTKNDLSELGIQGHQLDGIDFLPFDIVENIQTYALCYEYDGKNKILIESEDSKNIFNLLKTQDLEVSRSMNIISVISDNSAEEIIKIINGQTNLFDTEEVTQPDKEETVPESLETPKTETSQPMPISHPSPFEKADEGKQDDKPFRTIK